MSLRLQVFWDGVSGAKLYKVTGTVAAPTYTQITLPGGLTLTKRRPCFVEYWDGFVIITNFWQQPVTVYDNGAGTVTAWISGLDAPTGTGIGVGQAGGSFTGRLTNVYITYAHESATGFKFAESNPSPGLLSATLDLTNASITLSGLPTVSPDGRVNKIYVYLEAEGAIARLAYTQPFGSSTATIDISVAALEDRIALPNDGLQIRPQARTRITNVRYATTYHKRVNYGMHDTYPYRLYYSEVDEPEAVDPSNYFDTEGKETITGQGLQADGLVVFGRRCKYLLQGWTSGREGLPADMSFRQVDPAFGTVCHHSIVQVNGKLFFVSEYGGMIWDGANHYIGNKTSMREDFKANPQSFYNGIAAVDVLNTIYTFQPWDPNLGYTQAYVFYYRPSDPNLGDGADEPYWGFDRRTRIDSARASWREDDGTLRMLTGSTDGIVRYDDPNNVDDDADAYAKRWVIVPKHDFMGVPGGGLDTEGKRFDRLWVFMNCQDGTLQLASYAGDENAYASAYAAGRTENMLDPTVTASHDGNTYSTVAKSVWEYKPDLAGRGITVEFSVASPPVAAVWYGYSCFWRGGASGALAKSKT